MNSKDKLNRYPESFYENLQLGRRHAMDPADEFNSPYVYVGNNPVNMVDPNGAQAIFGLSEFLMNLPAGERISPVKDPYITSWLGARIRSTTLKIDMHRGLDIVSQSKDYNIYAPQAGVITGLNGGDWSTGGLWIEMKTFDNGDILRFMHLKDYANSKFGDLVSQGQVIGTMGNTGKGSNGLHLHYALIREGKFVNPLNTNPALNSAPGGEKFHFNQLNEIFWFWKGYGETPMHKKGT
jgi:murein DD-endopeptidase MepM/ murein hydrolase activator NlpD